MPDVGNTIVHNDRKHRFLASLQFLTPVRDVSRQALVGPRQVEGQFLQAGCTNIQLHRLHKRSDVFEIQTFAVFSQRKTHGQRLTVGRRRGQGAHHCFPILTCLLHGGRAEEEIAQAMENPTPLVLLVSLDRVRMATDHCIGSRVNGSPRHAQHRGHGPVLPFIAPVQKGHQHVALRPRAPHGLQKKFHAQRRHPLAGVRGQILSIRRGTAQINDTQPFTIQIHNQRFARILDVASVSHVPHASRL